MAAAPAAAQRLAAQGDDRFRSVSMYIFHGGSLSDEVVGVMVHHRTPGLYEAEVHAGHSGAWSEYGRMEDLTSIPPTVNGPARELGDGKDKECNRHHTEGPRKKEKIYHFDGAELA